MLKRFCQFCVRELFGETEEEIFSSLLTILCTIMVGAEVGVVAAVFSCIFG